MPNGDSHPTLRRVCAERRRLTETQEAQLAPTVRDLCDQARSSRDLGIFHRVLDWYDCMSAGCALLRGNGECVAEIRQQAPASAHLYASFAAWQKNDFQLLRMSQHTNVEMGVPFGLVPRPFGGPSLQKFE